MLACCCRLSSSRSCPRRKYRTEPGDLATAARQAMACVENELVVVVSRRVASRQRHAHVRGAGWTIGTLLAGLPLGKSATESMSGECSTRRLPAGRLLAAEKRVLN